MLSILAILLSLALLMFLAYRGISVLLLAPAMALLAAVLSPGAPLLAALPRGSHALPWRSPPSWRW